MTTPRGRRIGAPLSPRQDAVLLRLASGDTPEEVAAELDIAVGTVHKTMGNARVKLEAKTTAHAIAIAYQRGILQ